MTNLEVAPGRAARARVSPHGGVSPLALGGAALSQRLRQAELAQARRGWVERRGVVPASVPVWPSRQAWTDAVRTWAASPAFRAVCAALGERGVISPAALIAVAVALAEFADHATGRNTAVTNRVLAARAGCCERTVTTARTVLAAAGLGVEAQRGHGSANSHTAGNRPSIWHLISRHQPTPKPPSTDPRPNSAEAADDLPSRGSNQRMAVDTCDLPPLGGSSSLHGVENYSPSARVRAPEHSSARPLTVAHRPCRVTPRPLAVQQLAGQLVADTHGLGHQHIGAICDAITSAGIDPAAWSAKAICSALDADMRATGWSWPDTIHHPGAFLASRLRRLPQPVVDQPLGGGCAAADLDKPHSAQPAPPPRYVPGPPLVLTDAQRERIDATKAVIRQHFANRARRKTASTAADTAQPRRKPQRQPACEPTVCATCGGPDPIRRPYLPTRRAHICEQCWAPFVRPAPPEAAVTLTCDPIHSAVRGCGCVVCGWMRAAARPQLPLKSMVCDRCCSVTAPPQLQADNSVDDPAKVVSA